jgi:iron complex outermembrane receptor protein
LSPPNALADASLEELMGIEVTSVSKKPQRLASTAASVFVITAEDIRRSGITVLPELLRLAPGVQVARLSSGSWAIGIRGFNVDKVQSNLGGPAQFLGKADLEILRIGRII